MKKIYLLLFTVLAFINSRQAFSQNDTILIDFGSVANASPGSWNNLNDVNGAGNIVELINSKNDVTGIGINVFDRFNGINESGTTTPDAALQFPASATRDSYYGSVVAFAGATEPEAGIQITGLNPAKTYTFSIFASRAGVSDNREAKYKFVGNTTDSVYLNASNNTSNTATASLKPKADGTIDLLISPGENNTNSPYKFYYLGALKIIYESIVLPPAPTDTILIDFGSVANASPAPWNNLNDVGGAGQITQLRNSMNLLTGMGINVFNRFNGINETGTTSPDASLLLPASATRDNYYGSVVAFAGATEPEAGMQITGLNPSKKYTFTIFASRSGVNDNREAKYKFIGSTTDSVYLNASNNTTNTVSASIQPKDDGTIDLWVSPGENNTNSPYKFYYIGALKMVYEHEEALPASLTLLSPNGGEEWLGGSTHTISWTGINLTDDVKISYSIDNGVSWIPIDTVPYSQQSVDWVLPKNYSNQCLVNITSGAASDNCDALLTIQDPNDAILIDFGSVANASPAPWNNLNDVGGAGQIAQLRNTKNLLTGMGINVFDRFNGINETGTTSPDASLLLPASATRDNYYGSVVAFANATEPEAGMQITGLNPTKTYTFTIFASRTGVNDNREAKYKFIGSTTDSVYLNASNNTTNTVSASFQPKADGTIDLWVSPGENNTNSPYKFYYIGALKMVYEHEEAIPATLTLLSPNGGEEWLGGSTHTISWTGINLTEEVKISYSIDNGANWIAIDTVPYTQKSIDWVLPETPSTQCQVKITSGTAIDASETNFTIQEPTAPSLTLLSPDADEHWIIGSTHSIAWSSLNITNDIEIRYSTDNGNNWTDIASVPSAQSTYKWTIPDTPSSECLIKINSGVYADTSKNMFTILAATCSKTIVVLGSSTAYGTGPSNADSAWVKRYTKALKEIDPQFNVVNLALGGYTTFQILPTGTTMPGGVTESIDVNRNVTKALTYSPYAIIINMPSNDATKNYSVDMQMANFEKIRKYANAGGANVWITTSQPRNFSNQSQIDIQKDLAVAVMKTYDDYGIDFWTRTSTPQGLILSQYNVDGVHLNNTGHRILFEEVMAKQIHTFACISTAIQDEKLINNGIRVYPNPFSDHSVIEFETASSAKIEIRFVDQTGRQVGYLEKSVSGAGTHTIPVSEAKVKSSASVIFAFVTVKDQTGTKQSKEKLIRVNPN